MVSKFTDILNEEILRRNNQHSLTTICEISLYVYKDGDNIISMDREFTRVDETVIKQKEIIQQMADLSYYIIRSNNFKIDIDFEEIFDIPIIKLILQEVEVVEKTNIPDENKDFQKLFSNDIQYDDILFLLKKCYFKDKQNLNQCNHIIINKHIPKGTKKALLEHKSEFSKKKVLKYGKVNKIQLIQRGDVDTMSLNSHSSVQSHNKAVCDKIFDFKKKSVPAQQIDKFTFPNPRKKQQIEQKDIERLEIIPRFEENVNQLENSFNDELEWETSFQEQQEIYHSGDYENIDEDEEEEEIQSFQLHESDRVFQQLKKNSLNINAKKEKLKARIPINLRSDKKRLNNSQDIQLNIQKELEKTKKKRTYSRGQKKGYQEVLKNSPKKNLFPNRNYLILSDDDDDSEEEKKRIKQLVINMEHQLPPNPIPKFNLKIEIKKKEEEDSSGSD